MPHSRRRTIGLYMPGTGTGGPWRYVHSILGRIDLSEFDVRLFCDIDGQYAPRPEIRVVPLSDGDGRNGSWANGAASAHVNGHSTGSVLRKLLPREVKLWAGFGKQAYRLSRKFRHHPVDL